MRVCVCVRVRVWAGRVKVLEQLRVCPIPGKGYRPNGPLALLMALTPVVVMAAMATATTAAESLHIFVFSVPNERREQLSASCAHENMYKLVLQQRG